MSDPFEINSSQANQWWHRNDVKGALLNNLMVLFIVAPIALVFKQYYTLRFIVFSFMVPYGLLVRHLAVRAVRSRLQSNPDLIQIFRDDGIIVEKL